MGVSPWFGNSENNRAANAAAAPGSTPLPPLRGSVSEGLTRPWAYAHGYTQLVGQLKSVPNSTFVIDFYASDSADPSGFGEGNRWLGRSSVATNDDGTAPFSVALLVETTGGKFITATATDSSHNTSEFSIALMANGRRGSELVVGGGIGDDYVELVQGSIIAIVNGEVMRFEDDGTTKVEVHLGRGNDTLISSISNDTEAYGDEGDDIIRLGSGDDKIDGGPGDDVVDGGSGADSVTTGDGQDTVITDSEDDLGVFGFEISFAIARCRPAKVHPMQRNQLDRFAEWSSDNSQLVTHAQLADNTLAVLEYPRATCTVRSALLEVDGYRRRQFVVCGARGRSTSGHWSRPSCCWLWRVRGILSSGVTRKSRYQKWPAATTTSWSNWPE